MAFYRGLSNYFSFVIFPRFQKYLFRSILLDRMLVVCQKNEILQPQRKVAEVVSH